MPVGKIMLMIQFPINYRKQTTIYFCFQEKQGIKLLKHVELDNNQTW